MATQANNIFGAFSGKVGHVVGTSWRGKAVLRMAQKKSNKKPSPAQVLQRAKFSAAVGFLNPIKPFLAARFGKMEGVRAPYDLALSYHLLEAIEVQGDDLQIIYPKVCISKGHLRGVDGASAIVEPENQLTVQWRDNSAQSFANPDDLLTIVLYVPSSSEFYFFENIAQREDISVELSLPDKAVGVSIYCWATFITFTGDLAATSCYIEL